MSLRERLGEPIKFSGEPIKFFSSLRKANKWIHNTNFRVPRPCKYENDCSIHKQGKPCPYIHPDEPEWEAAKAGTLRYNRSTHKFSIGNSHINNASAMSLASGARGAPAISAGCLAARASVDRECGRAPGRRGGKRLTKRLHRNKNNKSRKAYY